jgi:hypothetical protein
MSESGTDYVVRTKHFVIVPIDTHLINQDVGALDALLDEPRFVSRLAPDIQLLQEGYFFCDDRTSL